MAQEVHVCVPHIGCCYRGDRYETEELVFRPHDRPAERNRGALTCIAMHDPAREQGVWYRCDSEDGEPVVRFYSGRDGEELSATLRGLDRHAVWELNNVITLARDGYALGVDPCAWGDYSAFDSQFAPHHGGYCAETAERCEATP